MPATLRHPRSEHLRRLEFPTRAGRRGSGPGGAGGDASCVPSGDPVLDANRLTREWRVVELPIPGGGVRLGDVPLADVVGVDREAAGNVGIARPVGRGRAVRDTKRLRDVLTGRCFGGWIAAVAEVQ